jgi:FkbM family methyltransferase
MIRYIRGSLPGLAEEHDLAILEGDTHIGKWVEESKRLDHDQNALPLIGELIHHGDVVYDIGAFIGDHTGYYAERAGLVGHVVAFEVAGDAFECLDYNMRFYPNVTCLRVALGDGASCGELTPEDNKGARSLPVFVGGGIRQTTQLDFVIRILLRESCRRPNFIKLDIEGWETRVLIGASELIYTCRPTIVCEVNREALERTGSSPWNLYMTLKGLGYRKMADLFTGAVWDPVDDKRPQFDVVCRP